MIVECIYCGSRNAHRGTASFIKIECGSCGRVFVTHTGRSEAAPPVISSGSWHARSSTNPKSSSGTALGFPGVGASKAAAILRPAPRSRSRWKTRPRTSPGMPHHSTSPVIPIEDPEVEVVPTPPDTRPGPRTRPLGAPDPMPSIFRFRAAAPQAASEGSSDRPGLRKWTEHHESLGVVVGRGTDPCPHFSVRLRGTADLDRAFRRYLSKHRFFVGQRTDLKPGDTVTIDFDLAGLGTVSTRAVVTYTVPELLARAYGRPGAGLTITKVSAGYWEHLHRALTRARLRPHATVFVGSERARKMLANTGYILEPIPSVKQLIGVLESDTRVAGLVLDAERQPQNTDPLVAELVPTFTIGAEVGPVLANLDAHTLRLAEGAD